MKKIIRIFFVSILNIFELLIIIILSCNLIFVLKSIIIKMDKELFSQLLCKKKPLFVYLFNCVIVKKKRSFKSRIYIYF